MTHDLDEAYEMVVYAKLPHTFQIPPPAGNYTPNWDIAMKRCQTHLLHCRNQRLHVIHEFIYY
nr:hypothetical protein [Alistipes putredinis]